MHLKSNYPLRCDRRAAVAWLAVVMVLAGIVPAGASLAGEVRVTNDFADVAEVVHRYADQYGPERVLLVVDIDNTLLAMNGPLGSDQWFEWQEKLLEECPHSSYLVAPTFDGLLEVQGLLYNLGRMRPPQPDLPALVSGVQDRGIPAVVLTSRGDDFRVATKRELLRNGYDMTRTAVAVEGLPGGRYLPYDPQDPQASGLTAEEFSAFELGIPRYVSYADGILMVAGQHKGAMLLLLLEHVPQEIRAIVYVDDHERHTQSVFDAASGRGIEVTTFRYGREDRHVRQFHQGNKRDVICRWRRLSCTLYAVFE